MLAGLNTTVTAGQPNSLLTGNTSSLPYSLTAATSCPTDGTDGCIQLRLDAVGYALTQLFIKANAAEKVANQFRIGLYPFVTNILPTYSAADRSHQRQSHDARHHQLRRCKPRHAARHQLECNHWFRRNAYRQIA